MVLLETSALSLSVSAPCLGGQWEERSWRDLYNLTACRYGVRHPRAAIPSQALSG